MNIKYYDIYELTKNKDLRGNYLNEYVLIGQARGALMKSNSGVLLEDRGYVSENRFVFSSYIDYRDLLKEGNKIDGYVIKSINEYSGKIVCEMGRDA